MSIPKLAYSGSSKIIKNLVNTVNALIDDNSAIQCDKTTAGTYVLKATVDAQGNVTYTWESE
jgi:hypothetical protein